MHCLYFIYERKFYARTHVKITRLWKPTLRESKFHEGGFPIAHSLPNSFESQEDDKNVIKSGRHHDRLHFT